MRSIQVRLTFAFFCIVALLLIQGIVAYRNIKSTSEIQSKAYAHRLRIKDIELSLASTRLLVYKILGTMNPQEMDFFYTRFRQERAYLKKALISEGIGLSAITENFEIYEKIIALQYDFSTRTARRLIDRESKPVHESLVAKLRSLSQIVQNQTDGEITDAYRRSLGFTLTLLISALVAAVLLAVVLARTLMDRQQAESGLRESEERYRRLAENSPDMIYRMAIPSGTYEYVSPAATAVFGYPPEVWYEKPRLIRDLVHPDWHPYFDNQWENLLNGDLPPTYDYKIVHSDGSVRWINQRNVPVKASDSRMVAIEGIVTDISELKRMEDELRQAHKMEAVGTLAGGIAHDFNNILGIIIGNTELAIMDVPEGHAARSNLNEILTAGVRAKDVVHQLLSFSRKSEHERRPIDIVPLIIESVKLLRASIPSTIEIRTDIAGPIDPIKADPTQIQQVIINLCTNASQAMEGTGGVLTIAASTLDADPTPRWTEHATSGRQVRLIVRDTGPGIDPDVQDRIFDPYFTTKAVGKGSGMGLSIVHGIVMNHAGSIFLDSAPGKGTTMEILFPACKEPCADQRVDPDEIPTGKETILLVDDESSILTMTEQMLHRLGYRVESTKSAEQAVAMFQTAPTVYDLVVTDMTMPMMTGAKLAQKIKQLRSDVPVIVCTGYSALIDEQTAKAQGIAAFVMKPVVQKDLAKIIRGVLDHRPPPTATTASQWSG